jgi:hypothetical protein
MRAAIAEPNARAQPRPEAAARHERRLEGVACRPMFGLGDGCAPPKSSHLPPLWSKKN